MTGGAGFIGSHVVDLLLSNGFSVKVLDNLYSGSLENLSQAFSKPNFSFSKGDVRDQDLLYKLAKGCNCIIHLAALVNVEEVNVNPVLAYDVNVLGTLNVLEACRKCDVDILVYSSSCAVYGEAVKLPIDEDHPQRPKSIYGATKLASEALINSYAESYGVKAYILRFFNVYGPRMKTGQYAGVIHIFIARALNNQPLIIYGDGEQTRDFIYIADVAESCLTALTSNKPGIYNIGTGEATTINQLAEVIKLLTNSKVAVVYEAQRTGDIKKSQAKVDKAHSVLGWKAKHSLKQGLLRTIDWYKQCSASAKDKPSIY